MYTPFPMLFHSFEGWTQQTPSAQKKYIYRRKLAFSDSQAIGKLLPISHAKKHFTAPTWRRET